MLKKRYNKDKEQLYDSKMNHQRKKREFQEYINYFLRWTFYILAILITFFLFTKVRSNIWLKITMAILLFTYPFYIYPLQNQVIDLARYIDAFIHGVPYKP